MPDHLALGWGATCASIGMPRRLCCRTLILPLGTMPTRAMCGGRSASQDLDLA